MSRTPPNVIYPPISTVAAALIHGRFAVHIRLLTSKVLVDPEDSFTAIRKDDLYHGNI